MEITSSSQASAACALECGNPAVTRFVANKDTVRRLGLAHAGDDAVSIPVCAACYLKAMALVLDRAGLPRQQVQVEYWCTACQRAVPVAEIVFVGSQKVTPRHAVPGEPQHIVNIRATKGTAAVPGAPPAAG